MSPITSPGLLDDALEWLRGLDGLEPEAAEERLARLRDRHPRTRARLLWQREAATGEYHYDLLFPETGGCVSLSFAPDRAIPWPLRGSQRSGEQLLLRVNGVETTMERAVSVLDVLWEDARLARRLVDAALVEEALTVRRADPAADRLQEAMDAFRRARGLLTAEATRRWMAERGLSHARLEEIVAAEAAVAALRREVAEGRVEDFFAAHRAEFDRLRVLRLRYADPDRAAAAAARLRAVRPAGSGACDGSEAGAGPGAGTGAGAARSWAAGPGGAGEGTDPVALATAEVLAGAATCRMEANGRGDLTALFGAPAADARSGRVLGPAPLPDGGLCVAYVLAVEPAVLDEVTRGLVAGRIFDDWLAERRRHAHVEWFWGSRARTDELTAALRG
ncbi:TIGR04500 family putative peptide maturation system protein [Streptosporangium sandarakinum]|uniref:TIGR04500 family putative peptide maturation system protein n=1 Tax=Streptosporangium nondiastaticum TaxID=35764 RepID=UPI0031F8D4F8